MDTIQTIDKLKEVFAPVAEKIGQGAQYGWQIVIKQQYVTAWLGIFWGCIGLVGIAIGVWAMRYIYKQYRIMDNDAAGLLIGIIIFGEAISVALFAGGFITAITHFLNPDYYAIQFFINLVANK